MTRLHQQDTDDIIDQSPDDVIVSMTAQNITSDHSGWIRMDFNASRVRKFGKINRITVRLFNQRPGAMVKLYQVQEGWLIIFYMNDKTKLTTPKICR